MIDSVMIGDCLARLRNIPTKSVDLVYLDPPFFTQKVHALTTRSGDQQFRFNDVWRSSSEYAEFLYERILEARRTLKDSGSLFFHCNRESSHIARIVLDQAFGTSEFRSEIVWYFRRWSNAQKGLLPAHQTIFFYSKTERFKFNEIMTDYSSSTNIEQIIQKRARDSRGKAVYARNDDGHVISNGAKKGVPLSDVWEIPFLNPKARERVGYPTQKPILLLEQIIALVTNEGDLVVDPFCGSGTALVAAKLMNRHWIGIDSSPDAVALAMQRLAQPVKTSSNLLEKGRESYVNADSSVEAALLGVEYVRVQRNNGIDGILRQEIDGRPVFVRVQRGYETASDACIALRKAARNKGAAALVVVVTMKDLFTLEAERSAISDVMFIEAAGCAMQSLLDSFQKGDGSPDISSLRS